MIGRFTVTPEGLIIGCVVPSQLEMGVELKEGIVYELYIDMFYSELINVTKLGESIYPMTDCSGTKEHGCSLDKYLALAQGRHLLVQGEN